MLMLAHEKCCQDHHESKGRVRMVLSAGRSTQSVVPRLASRSFSCLRCSEIFTRLLGQNSAANHAYHGVNGNGLWARPAPVLSVILLHRASKSHRQSQRLLLVAVAAGAAVLLVLDGAGWCWMVLDGVGWCCSRWTCCTEPPPLHQSVVRRASHGSALQRCSGQKPRAKNGSATGRHSFHRSTGRLMAVIGDLGGSDESVSMSVSVERQRAAERENSADKQVALRHGRHGWLHVPVHGRGHLQPVVRVVPPLAARVPDAPWGAEWQDALLLYRGHPTDMAPQPYWHIGRLDAAKPCPRRTSFEDSCRHTHISPARPALRSTPTFATSPAFAHPSTIATASSLLQLPERRFLRSD